MLHETEQVYFFSETGWGRDFGENKRASAATLAAVVVGFENRAGESGRDGWLFGHANGFVTTQ